MCTIMMLSFRYADKVLTGDDVLVDGKDELSSEKVTNVTSLTMQGKLFTISTKTLLFNVKHYWLLFHP